jgi:hypothetical protein
LSPDHRFTQSVADESKGSASYNSRLFREARARLIGGLGKADKMVWGCRCVRPSPPRRSFVWRATSRRQDKPWKGGRNLESRTFRSNPKGSTPSRQGRASQPEASLAWAEATLFVKRGEQMIKPCLFWPRNDVNGGAFAVLGAGAAFRQTLMGEDVWIRPGSRSMAEAWDGLPSNLRSPVLSAWESRKWGKVSMAMPLVRKDRLRFDGSAKARHEAREGSAEAGGEIISDRHAVQDGVAFL